MRQPRLLWVAYLMVAAMLLSWSLSAWGQSEATSGAIRGTITDPKGGTVPQAKVTVKNLGTGYTRETQSGDDGYFNIPLLPVGTYELRVEKTGFATLVQSDIPVTVGGAAVLNVELKVGAASEVVEVKAAAPLVETTRTQFSSVVDDKAVSTLPLHGRNYLDFVLLTPGVVRDNNRAGDINFGGLKGTYNSLQIDGVDNNNNFFGQSLGRTGVRAPFQFSQEAVAEFQVKTNSYAAEYGRAGGAVINVVTKTGANDLHGAAFGYFRDNRLNANKWELNAVGKPKPPLRVWQFGAFASGPLVKDKAFWLFNYDAQRRSEPNPILCNNNAAFCAAALANPTLGPRVKDFQKSLDQDVYLAKVDVRITPNHNLSLRYNYQRFTGGNQENSGDNSVLEHTGNSLVHTRSLSGNLVSTFGARWINEFRGQWGRDGEPGTANGTDPEIQFRSGAVTLLQFGRNNFSPRETTINRGQIIDNVTYLRGKHTFRGGVDFNIENILNFFPGLFGGRYAFNCLADFQDNGRPDGTAGCVAGSYTQNFGGSGTPGATTHPNIREYSWFFQDDIRVLSNFTVNLGVRYDLQRGNGPSIHNPDPQLAALGIDTAQFRNDTNNFAPRIAFAYSPHFFGKQTVIRGGYGIYYGRTPSIMTATATSNNGLQVISITIGGASLPAGFAFPQTFSAPPTGATPSTPSLYVFDKNYVQPYVQQASLGVETEVAKGWSAGMSYLFVKGTHLSRSNNINLMPPVPTTFAISTGGSFTVLRFPTARPASNFGRITLFQANANSVYHGLALTLNKRFSHHFQAAANYTFSKAIDNKPDSTSVVPGNAGDDAKMAQNPLNLRDDRGPSDQDFRHRFVLVYLWELSYLNNHDSSLVRYVLGNWTISDVFTAQNGKHFSLAAGGDPNRDGNAFTDRIPGVGRNTGTLPPQISFDLRVQKDFPLYERLKLSFLFEAFNLFNRPNFRDINNTQFSLAAATAAGPMSVTPSCPTVGQLCFFPVASFGTFQGTYDQPGGGSPFPGPGPRTLQLALKLTW